MKNKTISFMICIIGFMVLLSAILQLHQAYANPTPGLCQDICVCECCVPIPPEWCYPYHAPCANFTCISNKVWTDCEAYCGYTK